MKTAYMKTAIKALHKAIDCGIYSCHICREIEGPIAVYEYLTCLFTNCEYLTVEANW